MLDSLNMQQLQLSDKVPLQPRSDPHELDCLDRALAESVLPEPRSDPHELDCLDRALAEPEAPMADHDLARRDAVQNGDLVQVKELFGITPLHRAAEGGHMGMALDLLEQGANVNAADWEGRTPLHRAIESRHSGHSDMVLLLCERGANVNATTRYGRTPLHWAAYEGNREIAQSLLEQGADPRVKDFNSRTARDVAARCRYWELATLLRGAEEAWTTILLQLIANATELTFRTMAGNVACTLTWESERPAQELPRAVLEGMRSSGFKLPCEPFREGYLHIVLPNGKVLETGQKSLREQLSAK